MTPGPLTLDEALAGRVAVWGMGAEGLALVALAVERGVEPLLIDDLAADAAGRVAAAWVGIRPVSAPAMSTGRRWTWWCVAPGSAATGPSWPPPSRPGWW